MKYTITSDLSICSFATAIGTATILRNGEKVAELSVIIRVDREEIYVEDKAIQWSLACKRAFCDAVIQQAKTAWGVALFRNEAECVDFWTQCIEYFFYGSESDRNFSLLPEEAAHRILDFYLTLKSYVPDDEETISARVELLKKHRQSACSNAEQLFSEIASKENICIQ